MALSPAEEFTSQQMLDTVKELDKKNRQLHERQDTVDAEVAQLLATAQNLATATSEWELAGGDKQAFYIQNVSKFARFNDWAYFGNRPS